MKLEKQMMAAILFDHNDLRVEKTAIPNPSNDEVLIKVHACGVCGTDYHIMTGEFGSNRPVVMGHEFAGEVVAIGGEVKNVKIGEHVTADINISCGQCFFCRMGQKIMCPDLRQIGSTLDGAFAEYIKVPRSQLYPLPNSMSWETGAYIEPLACVLRGLEVLEVHPGSTIAVIGGGPMGLAFCQMLKLQGASKVILSEPNKLRREKALKSGVSRAVDPVKEPLADIAKEETEGRGVDYVVEAVGSSNTFLQACEIVRRGGRILVYGIAPAEKEVSIKPRQIYNKELSIVSSFCGTYQTWPQAISLLNQGRFDPTLIVTQFVELPQAADVVRKLSSDLANIKTIVRI
jgi:L-iditol 2-dehydrogenase